MAEEETGGNTPGKIKAILTRKYFGVPVYIYGLAGILVLAWYLKKRAAEKKAAEGDNTLASTANQAFPYAAPMNYSSDVFINNQMPQTTPGSNPNVPQTVSVKEGTWLSSFLEKVNKTYPGLGLTEAKLRELNPQLNIVNANKFGYINAGNPSGRTGGGPDVPVINVGVPNGTAQVRIQ